MVLHGCHSNATCINTYGSYDCKCHADHYGNGFTCSKCPAFSESPYGSADSSRCQCAIGLMCGQEEAFNGSDSADGILMQMGPSRSYYGIPANETVNSSSILEQVLGGEITFAFYVQPFSMEASPLALSRGGPAQSLPLSECNLVDISLFVKAATNFDPNGRAPGAQGANRSLWGCRTDDSADAGINVSNTSNTTNHSCAGCHQVIMEFGADGGADVLRIQMDEKKHVVYEVVPTCSCDTCKVSWTSNATLPLFAWTHVAVVQSASGEVKIYLNASADHIIPSSDTRWPVARSVMRSNVVVGASLAQPAEHSAFHGKIVDLAAWNTSLSAGEVSQLHLPASRPIVRSEELALRKFSTVCDYSKSWQCIDIDECWADSLSVDDSVCPDNTVCTNTWGSYTCTCLSGFYKSQQGTCTSCSADSTSRFGSTNVTDCKCNKGFTGPDGILCIACEGGEYKDVYGSATCVNCPQYSFSHVASDELVDCICNAGYTGPDGGPCAACPPGSYKEVNGSAACTGCIAGKYSLNISSTGCIDCGAGKYSTTFAANSSSVCMNCVPGKYSNVTGNDEETDCTLCIAGKYVNTSGNVAERNCSLCPMGKYSIVIGSNTSDTCLNCATGKYLNTTGNDNATDCISCAAGKYLNSSGNDEEQDCIPCRVGTYSTTVGAPSSIYCLECMPGKFSDTVGNDNETDCLDCPASSYEQHSGSSACASCPVSPGGRQTFSGVGSTSVANCTDDITGIEGEVSVDSDVAAFESNTAAYREGLAATSGADLRAVEILDYSETDASTTSRRLLARVEVGGFVFHESSASISWSLASNAALSAVVDRVVFAFRLSVPRYFVAQAQQGLEQDLASWVIEQGLPRVTVLETVLTCGAGAEPLHPVNHVTSLGGDPTTNTSLNATVTSIVTSATQNMSANSTDSTWNESDVSDATTRRSYSIAGNVSCVLCDYGTYKNATDNSYCVACPAYSSTLFAGALLLSQCTCEGGYYSTDLLSFNTSCLECGRGYFCSGDQHRAPCQAGRYAASSTQSECTVCAAGKFSNATGNDEESDCDSCVAGKYSNATAATSPDTCLDCAAGTYSSEAGKTSASDCIPCQRGKYSTTSGANTSSTCVDCSVGKYLNASGAAAESACLPCPLGSYQDGVGASRCSLCPVDTYRTTSGARNCTECPSNSTTNTSSGLALGRSAASDCKCQRCSAPLFLISPLLSATHRPRVRLQSCLAACTYDVGLSNFAGLPSSLPITTTPNAEASRGRTGMPAPHAR